MKISKLSMQNFRCFKDLELDFTGPDGKPESKIIVGVNGSGKSSILDCMSMILDLFCKVYFNVKRTDEEEIESSSFFVSLDNINNESTSMKNYLEISYSDKKKLTYGFEQDLYENFLPQFFRIPKIKNIDDMDKKVSIPILKNYPVDRDFIYTDFEYKKKEFKYPQYEALEEAFTEDVNYELFFKWFKRQEDLENRIQRRKNKLYSDTKLDAVRNAIYAFFKVEDLPIKELFINADEDSEITVVKGDKKFNFDQLSDGEKGIIALIGDIARRLAIANPSLEDPLEGEGIVMIDEIELHLHPKWQHKIIPFLEKTFPNVQFIITTHSPQVLSTIPAHKIFLLDIENGEPIVKFPEESFGVDSNLILKEVLGAEERPKEIKVKIDECYQDIDKGNLEKAKEMHRDLENIIGPNNPEVLKIGIRIKRKEAINR